MPSILIDITYPIVTATTLVATAVAWPLYQTAYLDILCQILGTRYRPCLTASSYAGGAIGRTGALFVALERP